jgi:hypothetical protein
MRQSGAVKQNRAEKCRTTEPPYPVWWTFALAALVSDPIRMQELNGAR